MLAPTGYLRVVGVLTVRNVRLVVYILEFVPLGHFLDRTADYAELGEGVSGEYVPFSTRQNIPDSSATHKTFAIREHRKAFPYCGLAPAREMGEA